MSISIKRRSMLLLLGAYLSTTCYTQHSFAQTVRSSNNVYKDCVGAGVDVVSYEIRRDFTGNKDYLDYCQIIREKLKKYIKKNYKHFYSSGDIRLSFVLQPDGSLVASDIDRVQPTDNKQLFDIAIRSLKDSSPFPPFPESMERCAAQFKVVVSYREK